MSGIGPIFFIFLISTFFRQSHTFIPNALYGTSSPDSVFHSEMTKRAIIGHAIDFFRESYSETAVKNFTNASDVDVQELFQAVYGPNSDSSGFEGVIEFFQEATASVDSMKETKSNPKWHFDAESFQKGHAHLIEKVDLVVFLIRKGEIESARENLGQILHPLQDFYSHSNWVEMGNNVIMPELGVKGKEIPVSVSLLNEQTCIDCIRNFTQRLKSGLLKLTLIGPIGIGVVGGDEDYIYNCENNIIVSGSLTSGYYVNQKDDDGNVVNKPEGIGKCSHGGVLDGTSGTFAKGGINKDSENSLFSPHDYLHVNASVLAVNASIYFLNHIRQMVSDDTKWAEFLQFSPGPSLGFVVDVCASMRPYILSVRSKIMGAIESSDDEEITARKYLIVPFNDNEVIKTIAASNGQELKDAFDVLQFDEDCSTNRKLYQAIQQAALDSNVGGYIFATTDGYPMDSYLEPWTMNTIKRKQLDFTLSLIPRSPPAGGTGSQLSGVWSSAVNRMNVDPSSSGSFYTPEDLAKFRAFGQSNGGSVSYIQSADGENLDFNGHFNKRQAVLLVAHDHVSREFPVQVDSTIQQLDVTISGTSAHPPKMAFISPTGKIYANYKSEETSGAGAAQPHLHRITQRAPEQGVWTVKVDTEQKTTHYSVVVSASTTLTYSVKFVLTEQDPEANHPGVHAIEQERPLAGSQAIVEIKPSRQGVGATPLYLQFRDSQWGAIGEYTIHKSPYHSKGYYAEVTIPAEDFYIRIFGINAEGTMFVRSISVPIQPSSLIIQVDGSKRQPAKVDPITGQQTEGPSQIIYFNIKNNGPTGLFDIVVRETGGYLTDFSPKGAIIFTGSSLIGSATLSIPQNEGGEFSAVVTQIFIQANSGGKDNALASNSFSKKVILY